MCGYTVKWSILLLAIIFIECGIGTEEELPMSMAERLLNLIRPLSEISLRLRTQNDAFNRFVRFFLVQPVCPVKVFLDSMVNIEENRNNVILADMDMLKKLVEMYSSRLGVQFFVFEGPLNHEGVINVSRSIWNRSGIYKNYFLTRDKVYFYNPFLPIGPEGSSYGGLQVVKGHGDFEMIFKNLNGYPVRTYIFRSVYSNIVYGKNGYDVLYASGADANVAYSIAKIINCKLIFQHPDAAFFGHRLGNGSFDGALGRALRYETDLILTGFFLKDYLTRDIEFSVTMYMDKLCCFVRKAKRVPQSILPLFSLNKDMWLGFIGTAFFWALIWCLIRVCNLWIADSRSSLKRIKELWQYLRIFNDTWVIWMRVDLCRYPPFFSEKMFVVSLALVSVIFGAIFESSLATVYIHPLYYKDINTLQELDETQYKILIKHAAMMDDLFHGSSSSVYKRLDSKFVYIHDLESTIMDIMARQGGIASVTREASLFTDDINYVLTKRVHPIPECPRTYHIAYIFPKGSPFQRKIDELLLRFLNAGLMDYWIELMLHEARLGSLRSPEMAQFIGGRVWKMLTIEDLQLSFYVIVLGATLSTLVLLFEFFAASRFGWGQ